MGSAPIEDPVADVVEQHQEVEQGEADDQEETPSPQEAGTPERGWEVDEADAAEQSQEVPLDEEAWR